MPSLRQLKKLLFWIAPHGLVEIYRARRLQIDKAELTAPYRLPEKELSELFPGIQATAVEIEASKFYPPTTMMLPVPELLTLMALCRFLKPLRVFEIGTYTGESVLAMARHCTPDARLITLDFEEYPPLAFRGTPQESQIQQILGDTRKFDFSPHYGSADLVFVDADHSYPCVKQDTATAFQLVKPGGVIVWDDYVFNPRHPECSGVKRALEESDRTIYRLKGTRFGIYKA